MEQQLTTRFQCPIQTCEWQHDEPPLEVPDAASETDINDLVNLRGSQIEDMLREHFTSHTVEEWVGAVSALQQQLAQQQTISCLACVVAQHNAQRDGTEHGPINPAAVIANGSGICLEHLKISDKPAMPDRTRGGIVLPPGTMNGKG